MDYKLLNEKLKQFISLNEEDLKPFKFTVDFGDDRPEAFIEYGKDEQDAKENLLKSHKYLNDPRVTFTKVEPVKEDHEYVTEDFMMIHKSGDGPDASGTVTFIPAPFGYEYDCSVKEFNDRGPQWSTIRTIEGIRIWFRNVLFEFGAKEVTIGKYHWDIDDFPEEDDVDESLKEDFPEGKMLDCIREINAIAFNPDYDYDEVKEKLEEYRDVNNLTDRDIAWVIGEDSYHALYADYDEEEEFEESVNETLVTFEDRCNWINEDGKEAQFAIENIMNKFDHLGKNYNDEKQGIICDRICEILEQCTTNLNDIAKRMK